MSLIDIRPRNTEPIKRSLLYELYVRFTATNECLNMRLQRMDREALEDALDYGYRAIQETEMNGPKERYAGKEEIGLCIIMLLHKFDFCSQGTELIYPLQSKPHKYNVGDQFTVKIAAVHELYGKPVYDIEEIPGLVFDEERIDAMTQKR